MRALLIALAGCVLALLLALGVGIFISHAHRRGAAPPATTAGLQVEGAGDTREASTKLLRCFVGAQFVGMETLSGCASRNGVAAQTVDDGLDPATGAAPNGTLAPPPPAAPPPQAAPEPAPDQTAAAAPAPVAECLRYGGEGWRSAASGVSVGQCARALFEGRCVKPGEAVYGRWGAETLRLVTGRVEMSSDNRSFHPLVSQNPDCSLPSG